VAGVALVTSICQSLRLHFIDDYNVGKSDLVPCCLLEMTTMPPEVPASNVCKIVASDIVSIVALERGAALTTRSRAMVVVSARSACWHLITAKLRGTATSRGLMQGK
jgi:hypothetical protein